jgi:hypothetical protein
MQPTYAAVIGAFLGIAVSIGTIGISEETELTKEKAGWMTYTNLVAMVVWLIGTLFAAAFAPGSMFDVLFSTLLGADAGSALVWHVYGKARAKH